MRNSTHMIRQALRSKKFEPFRVIRTSDAKNADILTWYRRVDAQSVYIVLLQEFSGGYKGCELFIQADTSNSTEKTIEAIP